MPFDERKLEATLDVPLYKRDVTSRIPEMEGQMQFSLSGLPVARAYLLALIENTEDMVACCDQDMRLTMFNDAYRRWVNQLCDTELYLGMHLSDFLSPELYALMRDDFTRALSGAQFCNEFTVDARSGRAYAFTMSFNPIIQNNAIIGFSQLIKNVTAHKEIEEALLESEQRFRNMFKHSPDAVFVEDFEGNVLDVNPAACRLQKMAREELIGKSIFDLVPLDRQDEVKRAFAKLVTGEQAFLESVSLTKDGTVVPVEIGVTHFDYLGQPALMLQVRDITVRKQAEAAQLRRNRELAMLNRASQALNSTLDQDQILAIVVEEVRRLLGVFACSIWLVDAEANELVCRQASGPKSEIVLGWRLSREQGIAGWVSRTGKSLLVHDTLTDDRHFWGVANRIQYDLRSLLTVPLRAKQQVIGVLQLVDQEVARFTNDDMKLLEPLAVAAAIAIENARLVEGLGEQVAARTAEIIAERDRREAILHSAGDAIVMVDPLLRIQYVNPAFERLTGYTVQEAMGNVVSYLIWQESDQQNPPVLKSSRDNEIGWQGELPIRHQDGRIIETTMTMAPIRDAGGNLLGYVISHQDISRFKELERARGQFITNVSHQLRTPVTTLKLQAYLMQKQTSSEVDQRYLSMMQEQIDALVQLIEDIIEMTVLDSGQVVRVWDTVLMTDLLASLVDRFASQVASTNLELVVMPAPANADKLRVKGDSVSLLQSLGKVLQNAIKFTPSGGRITLTLGMAENKGRIWTTLAVADTGYGIPPDELDKIFDRFFQGSVAESGQIPGTGLGLSYAQGVIKSHGGNIIVDSRVGEGSTFTIWLPMAV